jgi:hypothetical protein
VQSPTIGRIVHILPHPGAAWVPAIITRVFSDICVNARVFVDNNGDIEWLSSVMHESYEGNGHGPRWRWPPRD